MSQELPHKPNILVPVPGPLDKEKLVLMLDKLHFLGKPNLTLFHVVEVRSRTSPLNSEFFRDAINKAEKSLKPLKKWLEKLGYKTSIKVMLARDVAEGIIDEAELGGYDAILMVRRGGRTLRNLLKTIFSGSVSEKVARHVECPVIMVKME